MAFVILNIACLALTFGIFMLTLSLGVSGDAASVSKTK